MAFATGLHDDDPWRAPGTGSMSTPAPSISSNHLNHLNHNQQQHMQHMQPIIPTTTTSITTTSTTTAVDDDVWRRSPPHHDPLRSPASDTSSSHQQHHQEQHQTQVPDNDTLPDFRDVMAGTFVRVSLDAERAGLLFKHATFTVSAAGVPTAVTRRYSDFAWLHEALVARHPLAAVPALPPKRIGAALDTAALETRRRGLQRFAALVASHPVLRADRTTILFFTHQGAFRTAASNDVASPPPSPPHTNTTTTTTTSSTAGSTSDIDTTDIAAPLPPNFDEELARVRAALAARAQLAADVARLLDSAAAHGSAAANSSRQLALALRAAASTRAIACFDSIMVNSTDDDPNGAMDIDVADDSSQADAIERRGFVRAGTVLAALANDRDSASAALAAGAGEHARLVLDVSAALLAMLDRAARSIAREQAAAAAALRSRAAAAHTVASASPDAATAAAAQRSAADEALSRAHSRARAARAACVREIQLAQKRRLCGSAIMLQELATVLLRASEQRTSVLRDLVAAAYDLPSSPSFGLPS